MDAKEAKRRKNLSKAMKAAWKKRKVREKEAKKAEAKAAKAAAKRGNGKGCGTGIPHGRTPSGRFAPGVSGNPGGNVVVPVEVREACRALTTDAVGTLKDCIEDVKAPWAARVNAANAILDRAWGKAQQNVTVDGNAGLTIFLASLSGGGVRDNQTIDGEVVSGPDDVRH